MWHQVDSEGRPVLDLAHVLRCVGKLDAGIEERVRLVSRDGETVFVCSWKELNQRVAVAFGELGKMGAKIARY